jgi:hypothetical protein
MRKRFGEKNCAAANKFTTAFFLLPACLAFFEDYTGTYSIDRSIDGTDA